MILTGKNHGGALGRVLSIRERLSLCQSDCSRGMPHPGWLHSENTARSEPIAPREAPALPPSNAAWCRSPRHRQSLVSLPNRCCHRKAVEREKRSFSAQKDRVFLEPGNWFWLTALLGSPLGTGIEKQSFSGHTKSWSFLVPRKLCFQWLPKILGIFVSGGVARVFQ